jgi:hypothetical protein
MISATDACGICIQLPTVAPPLRSLVRKPRIAAVLSMYEVLALQAAVLPLKGSI